METRKSGWLYLLALIPLWAIFIFPQMGDMFDEKYAFVLIGSVLFSVVRYANSLSNTTDNGRLRLFTGLGSALVGALVGAAVGYGVTALADLIYWLIG
jgi:hypothetical protein